MKLEFYEGTEVSHNTPTLPSTMLCEKNIRTLNKVKPNMNQNLLSQTFVQSNSFSQDLFTPILNLHWRLRYSTETGAKYSVCLGMEKKNIYISVKWHTNNRGTPFFCLLAFSVVGMRKDLEVRLYPRLLVVRMLKASFKVRLWPISTGNAVMTYFGSLIKF